MGALEAMEARERTFDAIRGCRREVAECDFWIKEYASYAARATKVADRERYTALLAGKEARRAEYLGLIAKHEAKLGESFGGTIV